MKKGASSLLQRLFDMTKELTYQIKRIDSNMDTNEPEHIEELLSLISARGEIIEHFQTIYQQGQPNWSSTEQQQLKQLKEWETTLGPKLTQLHDSFSAQINKLQQGKQMTQRYSQGYGEIFTDGAYFDKRK